MSKRTSDADAPEAKKLKPGMIYDEETGEIYTQTTKAYKNNDFLMSKGARSIRILCEYCSNKPNTPSHPNAFEMSQLTPGVAFRFR